MFCKRLRLLLKKNSRHTLARCLFFLDTLTYVLILLLPLVDFGKLSDQNSNFFGKLLTLYIFCGLPHIVMDTFLEFIELFPDYHNNSDRYNSQTAVRVRNYFYEDVNVKVVLSLMFIFIERIMIVRGEKSSVDTWENVLGCIYLLFFWSDLTLCFHDLMPITTLFVIIFFWQSEKNAVIDGSNSQELGFKISKSLGIVVMVLIGWGSWVDKRQGSCHKSGSKFSPVKLFLDTDGRVGVFVLLQVFLVAIFIPLYWILVSMKNCCCTKNYSREAEMEEFWKPLSVCWVVERAVRLENMGAHPHEKLICCLLPKDLRRAENVGDCSSNNITKENGQSDLV